MKKTILTFLTPWMLLACWTQLPCPAHADLGKTVVLEAIQAMALANNPAILAAQKRITAEMQSFSQVQALDDNLKQYSAFTKTLANRAGPLKKGTVTGQAYPRPGTTALKQRVIQNQVDVLNEQLEIVRQGVTADIHRAYWDLVFIEKSAQIKSDTIKAFKRLKEVAETLYTSGKTSFQNLVKININIEILNEDLVTLKGQRQNIAIRLLELLNLPRQTRVGRVVFAPVPERPMTAEQFYPLAEKNRPELKVIRHRIRRLENMIELSESMIQGPAPLGFSTFDDTFPTKTMAAMANNSPIKSWYGVEDPWLNQTKQTLLSLRQTLVHEENTTIRMVSQAWFDLDRAHRELHLYSQRILPLSKSALDVSTGEYESGSIPFSQAIDAYTAWLGVKLAIAQRQTDIGIYTAILEKIVGKTSD